VTIAEGGVSLTGVSAAAGDRVRIVFVEVMAE
jgi:hypothetical protein